LSGLYVLLDAPFVAVIQIIIYAGAIMVLFLFVVMLLNAPHEDTEYDERVHPLLRPGPMPVRRGARRGARGGALVGARRGGESGSFAGGSVNVGGRHRTIRWFTDSRSPSKVTSILNSGGDGRRSAAGPARGAR